MTGIDDTSQGQCKSALTIKGEWFQCDMGVNHQGWAHSNKAAEAIWTPDPDVTPYTGTP